jgi:hypothetical protein
MVAKSGCINHWFCNWHLSDALAKEGALKSIKFISTVGGTIKRLGQKQTIRFHREVQATNAYI